MMSRKKVRDPLTRVMRSLDDEGDPVERILRLAWADRITFEEIELETGLSEADLIRFMRRNQSAKTFRRWRARVTGRATKHRTRFRVRRRIEHSLRDETSGNIDG